ncbi:MAG: helix-turn-helix domain-containing protein [Desulfobacterales bacterium]|nr:helix-turn-helix domain-containing protein [Desulfobacterales bacterium]
MSDYLKLHEITICKYANEGRIPALRIGRVWRFDKDVIDKWIAGDYKIHEPTEKRGLVGDQKQPRKKRAGRSGS